MISINKFIPYDSYQNVYQIDYNKLYSQGFKIILFDLDNTLSQYHEKDPSIESIRLIESLKEIGFMVIILSNNNEKRIKRTIEGLKVFGFSKARKPLKKGYKQVLDYLYRNKFIKSEKEIIAIGDQLLTDVFGANRMGIRAILTTPIYRKDEKWYTKLNRHLENRIIEKIKKRDFQIYKKIKVARGDKNV